MQLKFAFLCDYAQESGGKLNALGAGWDMLYAQSLPVQHPMMCFVAKLSGTIAEAGTKTITLRLIDADGTDIIPAVSQPVPFEVKPPTLEGNINYLLQLGGLLFQKYGTYAFHLTVQDNEMVSLPFSVLMPPTTS